MQGELKRQQSALASPLPAEKLALCLQLEMSNNRIFLSMEEREWGHFELCYKVRVCGIWTGQALKRTPGSECDTGRMLDDLRLWGQHLQK